MNLLEHEANHTNEMSMRLNQPLQIEFQQQLLMLCISFGFVHARDYGIELRYAPSERVILGMRGQRVLENLCVIHE
jgi:hypothetical protein